MNAGKRKQEGTPSPGEGPGEKSVVDQRDTLSEDGEEDDDGPPPIDFAALGKAYARSPHSVMGLR